jgi:hypothetical protein
MLSYLFGHHINFLKGYDADFPKISKLIKKFELGFGFGYLVLKKSDSGSGTGSGFENFSNFRVLDSGSKPDSGSFASLLHIRWGFSFLS